MGEVYLNKKPVVEEYEYAYVETADGAITKVPRNKIYPYVPASKEDVEKLSSEVAEEFGKLSHEIEYILDDSTIKDKGVILSKTYLASTDGKVTTAMGNAYTAYFPCKPSKKYRIRKINTKVFRVASTNAIPVNGMSVSNYVNVGEADNYEYMTSDDAKYIVICYYVEGEQSTPNKDDVYASLKIGVTAKDEIARECLNAVKEMFNNIPYQNVSNIKNIEMSDNVANPEEYLADNTIYKKSAFGYVTFDGYKGTGKIDVTNVSEIYTNGNQYAFFTETSFVSGGNCSEYVKTVGGISFYRVAVPQDAKYVGINFANDSICYVTFTVPYALNPYGKVLDFALDEDYERIFAKYFKSERTLKGKSFSILGDSYSTYFGWLPTGFDSWYANSGADGENTQSNSLNDVTETWWYKLMSENGMKLLINDSFSGTTICTTSWGGIDTVDSFVGRSKLLCEDNVTKEKPDFIFILGGLNDTWGNSPIGTVKYDDITEEDLKSTLPALSFIIAKLKKWNPQAKIVNLKLSSLPTDLLNGIDSICTHYGIDNILLDWVEISKENNHPTASGMTSIKNMIVDYFNN